ncbi:MAG TPA: inositol monophosphatase family protein [Dokdonella sp.]|uniref:inositol monophosphatase family protein n=1 Tax=Dokdonella sp. TaxID=2291710 RepID=UPI002D7E7269|nr:inositol monophosphatase family protein [Dokdonella sp.]HET9032999.1 inositol monophosphatase family protein [Dokdonella sp.]
MTLSSSFLAEALAVAHRAADAAALGIHARYSSHDFSVDAKADATPVTEADREAELAIKDVLRARFPDHAFLGEEHGREGESDFLWLIDPIDGTKAFVRGYPMFSTQIALMHQGDLVLGVSAAGEYGERAWAVRGGGAFIGTNASDGQRMRVSDAIDFGPMAAVSTGNLKSMATDPDRWQALGSLVQRVGRIRGYGDFLHYHLLARGSIDLVIESDLNILDIAALAVIVREAGGIFTPLKGGTIDLDIRDALAGTPALHAEALALFNP